MDIILNLAIGGTLGGELPTGNFQYEMVVDYVRVYQKSETIASDFSTLDFSALSPSDYKLNAFEGATASVVTDPTEADSTNMVLQYVEDADAKNYAGVGIGLDSDFSVDPIAFDISASKTAISARVWVDSDYGIGQVVRMQVADSAGSNDAHYVDAEATITQEGWNTLVFDFSQPVARWVNTYNSSLAVGLDADVVYDKISLFIDWGNGYAWGPDGSNGPDVGTPPSTERTYYIDDVTFIGKVPTPPGVFDTIDFSASEYALNDFEGVTASVVTDPQDSGNKVLKYVEAADAKNYAGVGIGLDSDFSVDPIAFDISASKTAISARVWVDSDYGIGQVVRMQVADSAGSNDAHYVDAEATITQEGWNTLVFDFSQPVARWVNTYNSSLAVGLDADVVYDKISLFIDWGNGYAWGPDGSNGPAVGTPPSTERTYYIDDVTFIQTDLNTNQNFIA